MTAWRSACWGGPHGRPQGGRRSGLRPGKIHILRNTSSAAGPGRHCQGSASATPMTSGWTASPPAAVPWPAGEAAGLGHRGDEDHGQAAKAMGMRRRHRLHGLAIWKAWYSFPATTEEMVEAGFDQDRFALDADLRRIRPLRGQVRPGGPPDRDRLRSLYRPEALGESSRTGRRSASISIPAT